MQVVRRQGRLTDHRDIQKRTDAGLRDVDDVLAEPGKCMRPADPASRTVVTPFATQLGSGGIPSGATPSYTCTWTSINPGVTIEPLTSITCWASASGMSAATLAILCPNMAMSREADRSCDGSMTFPPLTRRSYFFDWPGWPAQEAPSLRQVANYAPI